QHNKCSLIVADLNNVIEYFIFTIYIGATTATNVTIYVSQLPSTSTLIKITLVILTITVMTCIFIVTSICTKVATSAHKPVKHLYRVIQWTGLSIKDKLYVENFITRLTIGPVIGF